MYEYPHATALMISGCFSGYGKMLEHQKSENRSPKIVKEEKKTKTSGSYCCGGRVRDQPSLLNQFCICSHVSLLGAEILSSCCSYQKQIQKTRKSEVSDLEPRGSVPAGYHQLPPNEYNMGINDKAINIVRYGGGSSKITHRAHSFWLTNRVTW